MKKYMNAREVLPEELVKEIQKYVKGKHIYIPQTERKKWGSATGIRADMQERNEEISRKYYGGSSIVELAKYYMLSEERIRGIIYERQRD